MANIQAGELFEVLMPMISSGDYVVISKEEVYSQFPEGITNEDLESSISLLQLDGYIKVRYSDASVICLLATQRGLLEYKEIESQKAAEKEKEEAAANVINNVANETNVQVPTLDKNRKFVKLKKAENVSEQVKVDKVPVANKKVIGLCFIASLLGGLIGALVPIVIFLVTNGIN